MHNDTNRLVIVSNRLPVQRVGDGWKGSPGGLVTALRTTAEENHSRWIGWPGTTGEDFEPFEHRGIQLVPVRLEPEEKERYYEGFANRTLWPLYHNAIRSPRIEREWWQTYAEVNRRFARAAAAVAKPGDGVWVHDYHLQLVPSMLREARRDLRIGFFLHVPFPPVDLFRQLPWRGQILDGLSGADLLGFQTRRDRSNFLRTVEEYGSAERRRGGLRLGERRIRVEHHPISLDFEAFESLARDPETSERVRQIRDTIGRGRPIVLGVDRTDYSKGIIRRLEALERLLEEGTLAAADFAYVQVAVPSREGIPEYAELQREIDERVARINGRHQEPHRPLVKYFRHSIPRDELVAWYRAADVMLVTPLRDGMNLVAKEYVATRYDGTGTLILSELAGAARELRGAELVNPFDLDALSRRIVAALRTEPSDAELRMRRMRKALARHDIHQWTRDFLSSLFAADSGATSRSDSEHHALSIPL